MKRIVKIAALAAMVLALAGCKGRNRGPLLPNVSGKAGEIVVVIDKDNWEGEIGNALGRHRQGQLGRGDRQRPPRDPGG